MQELGPEEWTRALADTDGIQIVLAGPGAGKTEFLARRAAHLIEAELARPDQICVLTFSRRAAAELRARVEDRLSRSMLQIPASTFHSFCYRLLEYVGPSDLGWDHLPTILTGPEQVAFVGSLLSAENPTDWPAAFRDLLGTHTMAEEVSEFILRANESLLDEAGLAALAAGRADWRALPAFTGRYSDALRRLNRIDYGSLQASAVRLLEDPEIRKGTSDRYRYVLVDEYQDTTRAQARLCEQLSSSGGHLTVAADPSQSIYGFRGARPENVEEFARRADERIVLGESFRVPETVLSAANRLLAASPTDSVPPLRPAAHGGSVQVYLFDQHSHEAEWIASELQRLHHSEGVPYGRTAVLVRSKRRLLSELSRALARRGIPHDEPLSRLADTVAVRTVLDCVEACELGNRAPSSNQESARLGRLVDAAMARVLLGPLFETPLGLLRELQEIRARTGAGWSEVVRELPDGNGLSQLLEEPEWIRTPADQGFWTWWTTLPQLIPFIDRPETEEHRAAWSSLAQVLARITEREPGTTLRDYARLSSQEDFEATPLLSYRMPTEEAVTLATLHQAKGLEFEAVFIADAVEAVLPDLRRERSLLQSHLLSAPIADTEPIATRLAEELRLAYVGMTRARRGVTWTATVAGIDHNQTQPSRFLPLVAGVDSAEELPGAPTTSPSPVTARAAEAFLRRVVTDPVGSPARRLGAVDVLVSSRELRSPLHFAGVREAGSDRGLNPRDLRLSPSQAGIYERCPRRYALSRRLRLSDEETVYARFGSLIHEVLEAVERGAMDRGDSRGSIRESVVELDRRLPEYDFGPPAATKAWRERGVSCLTRLYSHWPGGAAKPIHLERELHLELEGTQWLGYADRIEELADGSLRIVDYKTSKRAAPITELSLQLGFYLLAASEDPELGPSVRTAEAWYPLAGDKLTVRQLPEGELEDVRVRLVEIAAGIQSESWEPRPHEGCERCPVRILCPEWPEGQEAFAG